MSSFDTTTPSGSSSRREFLKVSGSVAAASALSGTIVGRSHAGESSTTWNDDIDNMEYGMTAPISDGPDGIYPAPQPGLTKEI